MNTTPHAKMQPRPLTDPKSYTAFAFLSAVFAASKGDIVLTDPEATKAIGKTRDEAQIEDLVRAEPEALVSYVTDDGEAVAVAVRAENAPALAPTFVMSKGDAKLFVWVLDKPAVSQEDHERLRAINVALNGEAASLDDPWPIGGLEDWGWQKTGAPVSLDALEAAVASGYWTWNDATVLGRLDDALLARDVTLASSPDGMKTKPGTWKNSTFKFGTLLNMLTKHRVGDKDGLCILQGQVIGGERRAQAIKQLDILMLDLDTGEDIEALKKRVRELGWMCLIWTTHSHLKPVTEIKKDELLKWMRREEQPTLQDVVGYLRSEKRYRPSVLEGAELLPQEHTKKGVLVRIKHKPMPKFRMLFLLEKPFVIEDRNVSQRKAIDEWKERYAGVSQMLGAAFDRSCVDPSRLMFTPRHPKGAEQWLIEIVPGKALDIETVRRVPLQGEGRDLDDYTRKLVEHGVIEAPKAGPKEELQTPWLRKWLAMFADSFDAEGFWRDYGEERKGRNGPGWHFKCPNDAAHSNVDDPDDNAFFAVSAGDDVDRDNFSAVCVHDSCHKISKGRFLDMMIVEHGLTEDDLAKYRGEHPTDSVVPPAPKKQAEAKPRDENGYRTLKSFAPNTAKGLMAMNERFAFVTVGSDVRILVEPQDLDDEPKFMRLDAWRAKLQNRDLEVKNADGDSRREKASKVWLDWLERREFDGVCFEPNARKARAGYYNLWRGYGVAQPKPGASWSLLREHLRDNICNGNEEHFEFAMTWLADLFQNPGEKRGSAFVVRGLKGTGKSKLFDWVRKAMGRYAIKVSQAAHVTGNFNKHQHGVILMVCEEAFWAGNPAAGGVIKDLITSDVMMMEAKGMDAVLTSNYARLAFVSNEKWVVPAGLDDERRYFVLECGTARQKDTAYFGAIDDQMENGGLEAMVADLMAWTPQGGNWNVLRNPPQTEALKEQATQSLDLVDGLMVQMIEDGGFDGLSSPDVPGIELAEDEENWVTVKTFRAQIQARMKLQGAKASDYARLKGHWELELAEKWLLAVGGKAQKKREGSEFRRAYKCPSLREIRQSHTERYGYTFAEETDE